MRQMSDLDDAILNKISSNELEVDIKNGIVFGTKYDINNNRCPIGYLNRNANHILFSILVNGKYRQYYVCRAIYLFVHRSIPSNLIVSHVDNNTRNNCIENLCLIDPPETSASDTNCGRGRWTREEESFLINNYDNASYAELISTLNRSERSIRTKIRKFGIINKASKRRRWELRDDAILLDKYHSGNYSVKELAKALDRSESSIRLRANRLLGAYKSDAHLRDLIDSKDFYTALKRANQRNSLWMKCCMCDYDKYIELHHIDSNRHNNDINNIATLCPNHHAEITHGDHSDAFLYAIWRRKYSDGSYGALCDNKNFINKKN